MTETITTALTFDDLINDHDDDLESLRAAYEEVVEYATEEHGERPAWPDVLRQQAQMYDEAGKSIQRRQHVLTTLRDEYDDAEFTIKMLSGSELMDIETDLRMEAQKRGVEPGTLQAYRQQLTVDRATVAAPDAVPTDDDGNPLPSECPNPLTLALHEQVERLNTAGAADFRAPGFGDATDGAAFGSSGVPTSAKKTSSDLDPTADVSPSRGDSS